MPGASPGCRMDAGGPALYTAAFWPQWLVFHTPYQAPIFSRPEHYSRPPAGKEQS